MAEEEKEVVEEEKEVVEEEKKRTKIEEGVLYVRRGR